MKEDFSKFFSDDDDDDDYDDDDDVNAIAPLSFNTNNTASFLLSVSSRSNKLATIRIECGVLQSTKKIMQW